MKKKTVKDISPLEGKRVFLSTDFNVSMKDGNIVDDTRIRQALPTIQYLLDQKARITIATHLGRPKGVDPEYSLKPVANRLQECIQRPVSVIDRFWEVDSTQRIDELPPDTIALLENVRFTPLEEKNDKAFAKHLASMADYFVNDAFGSSHRAHASIVGIAEHLPSYAGLLMEKEIEMLSKALENPQRPLVVVIGGAKTTEKIAVIERMLDIGNYVLLGGAVADTFLAAWGFGMGQSKVDYEMIEMVRYLLWKNTKIQSELIVPIDVVVSDKEHSSMPEIVDDSHILPDQAVYDLGPKTRQKYRDIILQAGTVIWSGPMGLFEDQRFRAGNDAVARAIAECQGFTVVGGGDTITSVPQDCQSKYSHVSTGGSAMLHFIKQGTLPGIEVLQNA